jgi:hypothetical protein
VVKLPSKFRSNQKPSIKLTTILGFFLLLYLCCLLVDWAIVSQSRFECGRNKEGIFLNTNAEFTIFIIDGLVLKSDDSLN